MYGLTPEGAGIAVRRALAHATEWTDYDWQLVHEGPQPPALRMALDEELSAVRRGKHAKDRKGLPSQIGGSFPGSASGRGCAAEDITPIQ